MYKLLSVLHFYKLGLGELGVDCIKGVYIVKIT